MWTIVAKHIQSAVDDNMATTESIKSATREVDFAPSSGLAKMYLRQLAMRANNFDTELRAFLFAIQPAVKQEKENEEL
jgi:hypothetical protein